MHDGLNGALAHVADRVYRAVKEPAYLIVCQPVRLIAALISSEMKSVVRLIVLRSKLLLVSLDT